MSGWLAFYHLDFEILILFCLLLAPPHLPGIALLSSWIERYGRISPRLFSGTLLTVSESNLLNDFFTSHTAFNCYLYTSTSSFPSFPFLYPWLV